MNKILAVAFNTFRESVRDKVLYVIIFFGLLGLSSTYFLGQLALHDGERLIRDLGLAGTNLLGILVAIFIGVNLLHREIERRTAYHILPKPLGRWQFVLGKFLGASATMALICFLCALVVASLMWLQQSAFDLAMSKAFTLTLLEVWVITSVAVFFSSWTTPFLGGIFCLGIFILGRATEDLEQLATRVEGGLRALVSAIAVGVPNLNLFYVSGWQVDHAYVTIHGDFVTWTYVGSAALYALVCMLGALGLAVVIFSRRDLV